MPYNARYRSEFGSDFAMAKKVDVLIIGGGPAGTTVASLLKRNDPSLDILIVERENFPRDHIGESQLTATCRVLYEMGVWEKVEAAGFPVKIGSTYRWGKTEELWQVNFLHEEFQDTPRPSGYVGQRAHTAFQVDRSIYDKILLDHAESLGCEVREGVKATDVTRDGDRIVSVKVGPAKGNESESELIEARYYIDASGGSGILRRTMGVEVESPTCLRNIALWDYWRDAKWAETIGNGGTRAQIMSLGWGWIWFIPITSTRTSIGLVTPAEYLKTCGKKPEDLYMEAVRAEPRISSLVTEAYRENIFQATKDWSYLAERLAGENWFLVGDSCGFADPILSAGMTLAHVGGRKAAFTILELDRGEVDAEWLKSEFSRSHRASIRQHIRFAEYWYAANGCFTDLNDHCAEIAKDAGLDLTPEAAFQWIGTGGFAADTLAEEEGNIFGFQSARSIISRFTGAPITWAVVKNNRFKLNLVGAKTNTVAYYRNGKVIPVKCYVRGDKILPLIGRNLFLYSAVNRESDAVTLAKSMMSYFMANPKEYPDPKTTYRMCLEVIETLISEGWITTSINKNRPFIPMPNTEPSKVPVGLAK